MTDDGKIDPSELPPSKSGQAAADRFRDAMKRIVKVDKDELERREKAWQRTRKKVSVR